METGSQKLFQSLLHFSVRRKKQSELVFREEEDPGSPRPVSLTWVPGKGAEQTLLSAIVWHLQDKPGIRPGKHGVVKGRSCSAVLVSFYNKVTCSVDNGGVVDAGR